MIAICSANRDNLEFRAEKIEKIPMMQSGEKNDLCVSFFGSLFPRLWLLCVC